MGKTELSAIAQHVSDMGQNPRKGAAHNSAKGSGSSVHPQAGQEDHEPRQGDGLDQPVVRRIRHSTIVALSHNTIPPPGHLRQKQFHTCT